MKRCISVTLIVASTGFALLSSEALAQTKSLKDQIGSVTRGVASIPDFSGTWAPQSGDNESGLAPIAGMGQTSRQVRVGPKPEVATPF
jgi:hypothetical protein